MRTNAAYAANTTAIEGPALLKFNLLRKRNGPYPDSKSELTSPLTAGGASSAAGSRARTPDGTHDDYHELTGGLDPYEHEALGSPDSDDGLASLDDDDPAGLSFVERLIFYASRKAVRLGELACSSLMSMAVIFALFGEPIRLGFAPRSFDSLFLLLTICALALFLLEATICWCFAYFAHSQHSGSPQQLSPSANPAASLMQTPPGMPDDPIFPILPNLDSVSPPPPSYAFPTTLFTYSPWLSLWWALSSSASASVHISLESLLDLVSIASLLPQVLYMSEIITLSPWGREVIIISKAGFLIRLLGMIRWIPVDLVRVESVFAHATSRQWWTTVAWPAVMLSSSHIAVQAIKTIPSPIQHIRQLGLGFGKKNHLPASQRNSPSSGTETRVSPSQMRTQDESPVRVGSGLSARQSPSDTSPSPAPSPPLQPLDSPHAAAAYAASNLLRLHSYSSGSSNSSSSSNATPPQHPHSQGGMLHNKHLGMHVHTAPLHSHTTPGVRSNNASPASADEIPSARTNTPDSGSAKHIIRPVALQQLPPPAVLTHVAPFSPRLPLMLGGTGAPSLPLPHHRSPLLLNRQLSRGNRAPSESPVQVASIPASSRLISLTGMSPAMQHRRVSSEATVAPSSGAQSPAFAMSHAPSPLHAASPWHLQVGQQHSFGPPPVSSRAISLTAMSPVVTSRTLAARQVQQQQQLAASHSSLQVPTPLGSGPPTPMAAASPTATLHDSPLNRVRSLSGLVAPPMRMLASPALSSRALSGMAALLQQPPHHRGGSTSSPHDVPSPASLRSNLSPPMQLAQASPPLLMPPPVRLPSSRSAASSPRIRNSGSLMAYNPNNESTNVADNSPSLTRDTDDGSELLMLQHLAQQHTVPDEAASPIPPPESPRSASHLSHASHIGQLLSDYTAHRVVLGLLIILFAWHITHPLDIDSRPSFGLQRIQSQIDRYKQPTGQVMPAFLQQPQVNSTDGSSPNVSAPALFPPLLGAMLDQYKSTWASSLVFLRVGTQQLVHDEPHLDLLRTQEIAKLRTPDTECWIDIRSHSQLSARVDLATMIWLILMLPILLFVVYKDVHAVVTPIERMVSFVTSLARDPLSTQMAAINGANLMTPSTGRDLTLEESMLIQRERSNSISSAGSNSSDTSTLASSFVELTFQRLGMLLQVGFGMAGSEIIASNISGDILDPMIPGSRVYAIFGFCEISDFNKATEILEESIMSFVNQIAHIVHEQCHHFGGRVNKNIGPSFLLVWKFDREDMRVLRQVCKAKQGKPTKDPFGINSQTQPNATEERWKETTEQMATDVLSDLLPAAAIDPTDPPPDSDAAPSDAAPPLLFHRRMSSRDADPIQMPPLAPGRQRSASMRQSRPPVLMPSPSSHATQKTFGEVMQQAERTKDASPPPTLLPEPPAMELPSSALKAEDVTAPLTADTLLSHDREHDGGSQSSSAAPSAPPSRAQKSRRLSSLRSMSAVTPRKEGESVVAEVLAIDPLPSLVRSVSDSIIIEESPSAAKDIKTTSPPLIPSLQLHAAHLRMPTIGQGEMINAAKPMGFAMDLKSDLSTPMLLTPSSLGSSLQPSFGSSAVSSHFTSGVPSPIGAVSKPAIISPPYFAAGSPSQLTSSAMSRLFKLDSAVSPGGPTPTSMLGGFRRLSQPQLPATSELVEESDSSEEDGIHSIRQMIVANAAKRGTKPAAAIASAQSEPITQLTTPTHASPSVPDSTAHAPTAPAADVGPVPAPVASSVASTPIKKDVARSRIVPFSVVMPRRSSLLESQRLFANAGRPVAQKRSDSRSSSTQANRHSPPTAPAPPVRTVIHRIANQALSAFLSTLIHVSTDPAMLRWRSDPALLAHGYSGPNMGFGLHVGWAIEGAIGSAHKIDASYLSPNVNMTARLCSATRQYRIPLLFSGWFYKLLDPAIQKRCRHVDQVIVKGSNQPVDLYTFDVCPGWKKAAAASMTAATTADVSHGPASRSSSASSVSPNYAKMRSEWMAQINSMNFKLPTRRRHSNPTSSAADALAATAAQAASGESKTNEGAAAVPTDDDKSHGPKFGLRRRLSSIQLFPSAPTAAPTDGVAPHAPSSASRRPSVAADAPTVPTVAAAPTDAAAAGVPSTASSSASSTVLPCPPLPTLERSTTTPAQRKNSNPDLVADLVNAGLMTQLGSLLAQLQCDLPDNYVSKFNEGIKLYIAGDWGRAGQCLVQFQTMHRAQVAALSPPDSSLGGDAAAAAAAAASIDGPSNLILQFMGKHAFQAPKGWKGYRKLERK